MPVWSRVMVAGVVGPIAVPVIVTISPGETGPLRKLAAFTTDVMVGDGTLGCVIVSQQPPERLMTPKEVAGILCVSPAWVLDHSSRRRPHLPSIKLGKAVRFRAADIEQFIRECARMRGVVA